MSRRRPYEGKEFRLSVKREVIRTHGMTCWLCGVPIATFEEVTMDHVKKHSKGGLFEPSNLRPAHSRCNSERHRRRSPQAKEPTR